LDDNPFFAQVARAVEQKALSRGYRVSMPYSIFDIGDKTLQDQIETVKLDGAVVLGRFDGNTCKFFEKHYKNIVYVGRNLIDAGWDQVICDGYEASRTALSHLLEYGHRRIGYIGETERENRYRAFVDMVREHGLDGDRALVSSSPQDGAGGYMGAKALLRAAKPWPTAVFCATDVSAIAAIKCFTEAGIKVPKQLSVVSIDDIELAQYVSPMLTTVSIPKVELGSVAVSTLIDRIHKVHKMPMKIFLPHRLMIRESTAPLK
jgi:DNA-binding LacI/PurR family transcriptional regulator